MSDRRAASRARIRRQTIATEFGEVVIKRNRRGVRVTVITRKSNWVGRPNDASFAFVDLDDSGVDRLVARLQAIRGGRRALP